MTYSFDFRRHVLSVRARDCLTIEETSERFSVGVASIVRWLKDPVPKATRDGRPRKLDRDALAQDVCDHPDAYQRERAARFGVSQNTICNALKALNMTHKKSDAPSEGG